MQLIWKVQSPSWASSKALSPSRAFKLFCYTIKTEDIMLKNKKQTKKTITIPTPQNMIFPSSHVSLSSCIWTSCTRQYRTQIQLARASPTALAFNQIRSSPSQWIPSMQDTEGITHKWLTFKQSVSWKHYRAFWEQTKATWLYLLNMCVHW